MNISHTFLAPQKNVLKLNLVFMLSASSVAAVVAVDVAVVVLLLFFSKIESGNFPHLKIQISNYSYIQRSHGWKCYPCQYIKWTTWTHTHTNIYAARFSYVFLVSSLPMLCSVFYSCPFFAVKLKSILDEDEQLKKTRSNSRGDFFSSSAI